MIDPVDGHSLCDGVILFFFNYLVNFSCFQHLSCVHYSLIWVACLVSRNRDDDSDSTLINHLHCHCLQACWSSQIRESSSLCFAALAVEHLVLGLWRGGGAESLRDFHWIFAALNLTDRLHKICLKHLEELSVMGPSSVHGIQEDLLGAVLLGLWAMLRLLLPHVSRLTLDHSPAFAIHCWWAHTHHVFES